MCALADVVNFIRGKLEKAGLIGRGSGPPKAPDALVPELARVADTLANHAVADLRSQDNVTVMIVYLRNAHGRAGRDGGEDDDGGLEVHSSYWDVDDLSEGGVASPGPRQPRSAGFGFGSSSSSSGASAAAGRGTAAGGGNPIPAGQALLRRVPGPSSDGDRDGPRRASSAFPDALDTVFAEMPARAASKYGGGGGAATGGGGAGGGGKSEAKKAVDDDLLDFLMDDANF